MRFNSAFKGLSTYKTSSYLTQHTIKMKHYVTLRGIIGVCGKKLAKHINAHWYYEETAELLMLQQVAQIIASALSQI